MSDHQQGPGWWLASDGKWYPPQGIVQQPVYVQARSDQLQRATNWTILGCLLPILITAGLFSLLVIIAIAQAD